MMKQPALDQKTVKKTAPVIKGQDFAVSIGMNPFDRMTLVSLDQLPESVEKWLAFNAMISPTLENYGGKKLISLPEQYLKVFSFACADHDCARDFQGAEYRL